MRVQIACDALTEGYCVEVLMNGQQLLVEPHIVGFDIDDRSAVLAYVLDGRGGYWDFIYFDQTSRVVKSNVKSHAPRPDFAGKDPRFHHIICQVE